MRLIRSRKKSGRLGAFQKDILNSNVNSLNVALENVTASESSIRDADFAGEETAIAFSPHYLLDGLGAALIAATGTPGAADKPPGQAKAQGIEKVQGAEKVQGTEKVRGAEKAQRPEKAQRGGKASAGKGKAHADEGQNGDGSVPGPEQARICLQFTSPTKPALITASAGDGDDSAPDYRYLVVPLRALASA